MICESASSPLSSLKKHVVVAVRIKRRVEIHEIDRFVLDIPPQDVQVIAVVECVQSGTSRALWICTGKIALTAIAGKNAAKANPFRVAGAEVT